MKLRVVFVILSLLAAACGSETTVGEGLEGGEGGVGGALRSTPTPELASPGPDEEEAPEATPAPAATPEPEEQEVPPEQQEASVTVDIIPDSPGFSNTYISVFEGGTVKFVNRDSQPRSVIETHGEFSSPELAPGKAWVHKFEKQGSYQCPQSTNRRCFEIQDGTRPYYVGTIEVFAR